MVAFANDDEIVASGISEEKEKEILGAARGGTITLMMIRTSLDSDEALETKSDNLRSLSVTPQPLGGLELID